jgi:general secretion pathway protein G
MLKAFRFSYPPLAFEGRGTARSAVEGRRRSRQFLLGRLASLAPLHQPAAGPPPLQKQGRNDAGFTLVELMVVLVIIGLLATIVIINVLPAADRAAVTKAHADIATLEQGIEMYRLDNQRYPTTQEGLQVLVAGRYIPRLPEDPWHHPYRYAAPGQSGKPFTVATFGADGREGGSGNDADITN